MLVVLAYAGQTSSQKTSRCVTKVQRTHLVSQKAHAMQFCLDVKALNGVTGACEPSHEKGKTLNTFFKFLCC